MMVQERLRETRQYCLKLDALFSAMDTTGRGYISVEEFESLMLHPEARAYLHTLDLSTHDLESLFSLLDDGDGQVSYSEFTRGILRLRGQARAQDVIAVLHEIRKVQ